MPLAIVALIAGHLFWGTSVSVGIILAASLAYGFLPTAAHFVRLARSPDGAV